MAKKRGAEPFDAPASRNGSRSKSNFPVSGMLKSGLSNKRLNNNPAGPEMTRFFLHNGFQSIILTATVVWLIALNSNAQSTAIPQGQANEKPALRYQVDLSDAKNHYVQVTLDVSATGKTTELMMAVWTPGSYLVREYAKHIDSMTVTADDGTQLEFAKTRKNRWLVQTPKVKRISVSYRLYCNELSVRTNWLDRQFAVLTGAATFMTVPSMLKKPHEVQLVMPTGWTRSATSLNVTGKQAHTFFAENFDELVDSPIVAGNIDIFPFSVGGVPHQLVNVGDTGYWDGTQAATDLTRVVAEQQKLWGVVPYDRYLFLNIICESGGGLEHNNSTLIMASRWSFRDKTRYKSWLSLASHEFFHTWNVRRLRPKSLVQYDYENEVYTESLWIAEGITSYYQDLVLVRAGLLTQSEYLSKLSANIDSVQRSSGRNLQSLSDSSYDAWIKFYRPDENSSNTSVDYYSKGAVVAFLLDAKIRKLTRGKKSLDDVMRTMFESYAETGYTVADFRETASQVAETDLTDWFHAAVDSTTELDYQDVLALGLQVPGVDQRELAIAKKPKQADVPTTKSKPKSGPKSEPKSTPKPGSKTSPELKPKLKAAVPDTKSASDQKSVDATVLKSTNAGTEAPEKKPPQGQPWLGIQTGESGGRVTIVRVERDSPATAVGLNTGDEIIAIDGYRVAALEVRLGLYEVGQEIKLLISRRDQLIEMPIKIGTKTVRDWQLKLNTKPNKRQTSQLNAWLQIPK